MLNTSFKCNSRGSSQFSSIHNYVLVGKFLVFDFNQSTCHALLLFSSTTIITIIKAALQLYPVVPVTLPLLLGDQGILFFHRNPMLSMLVFHSFRALGSAEFFQSTALITPPQQCRGTRTLWACLYIYKLSQLIMPGQPTKLGWFGSCLQRFSRKSFVLLIYEKASWAAC